jgi:septal ring factor EnvC (AmiA/AmiB activator)
VIFEQIAKAMRDQNEQMANAMARNNELIMSSINNLTSAIARVEKQQEEMSRTIAVMSTSLATVSAELKRIDGLERRVERLEGGPKG